MSSAIVAGCRIIIDIKVAGLPEAPCEEEVTHQDKWVKDGNLHKFDLDYRRR